MSMQEENLNTWPILDEGTVEELRVLMEEEFDDLVETYLAELPTHVSTIQTSYASVQIEPVWRTAHTLKASSGSIGAARIAELCRQIEVAGRENASDLLASLMAQLSPVATDTEASLRATLGR